MEHPIANQTSVRIPLIEELSPYYLEDLTGSQAWESLDSGTSRSIYDRMAEILSPAWSTSFAGVSDPTQLYERFELFCLLQLFKYREVNEESLTDAIQKNQFRHWIHGRLGTVRAARRRLSEEMSLEEFRAPLITAGFGFASDAYLKMFFEALQRMTRF